jgi:Flp pilus assembly protein TadG
MTTNSTTILSTAGAASATRAAIRTGTSPTTMKPMARTTATTGNRDSRGTTGAPRRRRHGPVRRGIATIWGLASMGLLLAVGALVVDGAMLYTSHADLQIAADSGALAGASALTTEPENARARAIEYAAKNFANGQSVTLTEDNIELGDWDTETRTFTVLNGEDESFADAVRVTAGMTEAGGNPLSMAFAQVFGQGEADVVASSIAVYRPRDIVLVLDLSGSMNYDSQIRHIPFLGRAAVEQNLHEIWTELGANTYGNMGFETRYISTDNDSYVKYYLGLYGVPYPYPSGSWNDYINYVQSNSQLRNNGYRKEYGGLTFMNYLLERRRGHDQTPDLWMASAQPITAVKDSVDIFLDFIDDVATEDQVGLAVYTSSNGHGKLEHGLTDDIETDPRYHTPPPGRATTTARPTSAPGSTSPTTSSTHQRPRRHAQDHRAAHRRHRQPPEQQLGRARPTPSSRRKYAADSGLLRSWRSASGRQRRLQPHAEASPT